VEGNFLKDYIATKEAKTPMFQILLLNNDASDDVEVQEADQVDFFQVKKHLKNGGSVFITSKDSQKQLHPKQKRS
jgi:predicted Fe-Mo cluster-binding NifX family protein